MDIIRQIEALGIIPVVSIKNAADAVPMAQALIAGGLPAVEVTFRTAAAADAIAAITAAYPDMLVGAGTVLTVEQADAAIAAGAKFLVAPGLNAEVVRHAAARGVPMIPGCATPSDFEAALSLGLTHVKFFPAETLGGVKAIRAMTAPYGGLRVMATGGISPENTEAYLACPAVYAVGGSFIASSADIAAGKFERIADNARAAVSAMLGIRYADSGEGYVRFTATSIARVKAYLERTGVEIAFIRDDGHGGADEIALLERFCGKVVRICSRS